MRERGWLPVTNKDYAELQKLRDKRVDVMDWHGKWAPPLVVAIFQCTSIPMNIRCFFFDKATEFPAFQSLIISTMKVGGNDAVNELLSNLDLQFTEEGLKALVK